MPKLDFVDFRDITGSDNQVLAKNEGDCDPLSFWQTINKSAAISDTIQPVGPLVLAKAGKISIALLIQSLDRIAHPTRNGGQSLPYKCTKSS